MPATAVIGAQWGDEGKGKIVDFMAQDADIVVRYAGGGNAGHTVENDSGKFALRIIPCGIVSPNTKLNIIARGAVPEISIVVEEIKALKRRGVDVTRLRLDSRAHLVMPWHIFEDIIEEERRGDNEIGTTQNGIGPCYADKMRRDSVRAEDLLDFSKLKKKMLDLLSQKMAYFRVLSRHFSTCKSGCRCCHSVRYWSETADKIAEDIEYLADIFGGLDNLICETRPILWNALERGQKVLLEGAQGFLLDIDHGIHPPYVTSSCTGVASASQGSGIAPSEIIERIGVTKAYITRVGNGPFPTEMYSYFAQEIREIGEEYGTVTGRPRRCGWFDLPSFQEVILANGLNGVAITRLDILDCMETIGIGVARNRDETILEFVKGWGRKESVAECRTWESLPRRAKEYCERISCGLPIKYISVGPRREQTIVL